LHAGNNGAAITAKERTQRELRGPALGKKEEGLSAKIGIQDIITTCGGGTGKRIQSTTVNLLRSKQKGKGGSVQGRDRCNVPKRGIKGGKDLDSHREKEEQKGD